MVKKDNNLAEPTLYKFLDIANRYKVEVKTLVELGARDCTETAAFSKSLPNARIYSFECNPQTLPLCRKTVSKLNNVTLIEKAVSDKNGTVTFYPIDPKQTTTVWKDGNPGASSMFKASGKYPVEKYKQTKITVPSVTLRSFMKEQLINSIDLMWIDIQGAELMALKGFGNKISDVSMIHTEVEFFEIYSGQPLFREIKRYLNSRGFLLIAFTSFEHYSADAVFVNRDSLSAVQELKAVVVDPLLYYVKRLRLKYNYIRDTRRQHEATVS